MNEALDDDMLQMGTITEGSLAYLLTKTGNQNTLQGIATVGLRETAFGYLGDILTDFYKRLVNKATLQYSTLGFKDILAAFGIKGTEMLRMVAILIERFPHGCFAHAYDEQVFFVGQHQQMMVVVGGNKAFIAIEGDDALVGNLAHRGDVRSPEHGVVVGSEQELMIGQDTLAERFVPQDRKIGRPKEDIVFPLTALFFYKIDQTLFGGAHFAAGACADNATAAVELGSSHDLLVGVVMEILLLDDLLFLPEHEAASVTLALTHLAHIIGLLGILQDAQSIRLRGVLLSPTGIPAFAAGSDRPVFRIEFDIS